MEFMLKTKLLKNNQFKEFDDYIMKLYEEDHYNREVIIALALWLDYENYTWNEFSVTMLKEYLEKYPDDIFCFVLYAVNCDWVGKFLTDISFDEIIRMEKLSADGENY